ncbi:MAG: carboxypeptidase regulatory-like domain-containing protein [Acidobacteriota bacterium]|nr:MAG: carboxypeptidase regulatory-like domain-containing protein [Acidobacteriota bacterium]
MQRATKILIACSLFLFGFVPFTPAQVCLPSDCFRFSDGERSPYWNADVVFVGSAEKSSVEGESVATNFRISRPIKGIKGKNAKVFTSSSRCSFQFKVGEHYFVYASRGKDGNLGVSDCFPPVLLNDAEEDLEYAAEIAAGQLGTRIFGSVLERRQASLRTPIEMAPLEGIKVTIESEAGVFETRTDSKGMYVFKNIPPGKYEVMAVLPGHLRNLGPSKGYSNLLRRPLNIAIIGETIKPVNVLSPMFEQKREEEKYFRYWDTVSFSVSSLNSISGRVRSEDGSVPPQHYISLLWLNDEGKLNADPVFRKWAHPETGEYSFDDIPNGKYAAVINPANCHGPRNPEMGRSYFPGVVDDSKAELITLSGSQEVQLIDFRLPKPLKEREIKGIVVSESGEPVSDALVYIVNSKPNSYSCQLGVVAQTNTDTDGRFRLQGFEGYKYEIRAYKKDGNTGSEMRNLRSLAVELRTEDAGNEIKLIARPSY